MSSAQFRAAGSPGVGTASHLTTAADRPQVRRVQHAAKRTVDVLAALVLLALLSPLLLAIALAVRLESPGGALFHQQRLGRGARPFVMLKFRTMARDNDDSVHREYVRQLLTDDAPAEGGEPGVYKLTDDPRVTKVGRWLRRSSADELPQLLNVLRGDMSLVGPRPALPWEAELYSGPHRARFDVRPGLTGLWQVSGRSRLTMREALDCDVDYVRRWGLGLDTKILLLTLPAVLRGDGAR